MKVYDWTLLIAAMVLDIKQGIRWTAGRSANILAMAKQFLSKAKFVSDASRNFGNGTRTLCLCVCEFCAEAFHKTACITHAIKHNFKAFI